MQTRLKIGVFPQHMEIKIHYQEHTKDFFPLLPIPFPSWQPHPWIYNRGFAVNSHKITNACNPQLTSCVSCKTVPGGPYQPAKA